MKFAKPIPRRYRRKLLTSTAMDLVRLQLMLEDRRLACIRHRGKASL